MANVCNNTVHFICNHDDTETIKKYMDETFPYCDCYYQEDEGDYMSIEFDFESKWDFPDKEMNELDKLIKDKDTYCGTCLSTEWGNLYCAFHCSDGDGWTYQG